MEELAELLEAFREKHESGKAPGRHSNAWWLSRDFGINVYKINASEIQSALEIAKQFPEDIFVTVGFHDQEECSIEISVPEHRL